MLSGEGSYVGKRWKTTIGLISKSNFSCEAHFLCTFLCRFFCTRTTWNFQKPLSYTFYGGNVVRVPVHFFSLPLVFTLHWWPLAFLILSPPLQNFHVVLPTKMSPLFFISLYRPFSRLSFAGLPPTFLFLCLSFALYSKFVDKTIYLSLIL